MLPSQQFLFLQKLIKRLPEDVQPQFEKLHLSNLDFQLDTIASSQNNDAEKLTEALQAVRALIHKIENDNYPGLVKCLQRNGLYRMVYHYPKIAGIEDKSDLKSLLKRGYIGLGLSALAMSLFVLTTFFSVLPSMTVIATALFAGAMTYISGLTYGVINNLFATRASLPYFLLGHQPQQHSLLRTNDPVAQGIAWGVAASFGSATLAALGFAALTLITASFVPVATFVLPAMLLVVPYIALRAEYYARDAAHEYMYGELNANNLAGAALGHNPYQVEGLKIMAGSRPEKAAWLATNDRNLFGFTKVPLVGAGILAGMMTLSFSHAFLPSVLFSPIFSIMLPAISGGVALLALSGAGIYAYVHRNTQIDNRFKLAFDEPLRTGEELYLSEEDRRRFASLVDSLESEIEGRPSERVGGTVRAQRSNTPHFDRCKLLDLPVKGSAPAVVAPDPQVQQRGRRLVG